MIVEAWERQSFDRDRLARLGISVVFRGFPSDAGGPDYQEAVLSYQGVSLLRGAVEFHVRASDWYRHGHDRDRAYNSVILHVVGQNDTPFTLRGDGVPVPVLTVDTVTKTNQHSLLAHPCTQGLGRLSTQHLRNEIEHMGRDRFDLLHDRLAAELDSDCADQVIYRNILEALGYASNREAFRLLSDAVPYGWLMSIPPNSRYPTLLVAAGFQPSAAIEPPARLNPSIWRLSRLRPANHPRLRLRGISQLVDQQRPSLAEGLARIVAHAERAANLRDSLIVRRGDDTSIGSGRADEMAVSVVLPFVAAFCQPAKARVLFSSYPSPPANRWTRRMVDLLDQAGHHLTVRTAPIHQGLHHLYHGFCRPALPSLCPVCVAKLSGSP